MKLDKKQLPQLIVLGVLLVACMCFMAFQLNSGGSRPEKPKKAVEATVSDEPKTQAMGNVEPAAKAVFPGLDATVARRDPFQPTKLPIDPTDVIAEDFQPRPMPSTSISRPSVFVRPTGSVPRIRVNPFNPFKNDTPDIKPIVEEEKDPEFALTGIVRGAENVAVIRVGETGRYVVKQGQFVEGRYQVISVTNESATLRYRGRLIHIKLGGVNNAS